MAAISMTTKTVPLSERAALSVRDAGIYAGIGRTKIYQLLEEQKLRSVKIGDRRLVLRESIDRLLTQATA